VATILTGTYEVETVSWGDRPVRTVVHGPEYRHQTGPLLGLLPVPGRLLTVTRRELTYDCRGTLAGGTQLRRASFTNTSPSMLARWVGSSGA
jgi:hypothetical protein